MSTVSASPGGRIRRSVRFSQVESQNAQAQPLRQRFTVADHIDARTFQHTQDWTEGMGVSPSGRFRVIEKGEKRQRPVTREGIRRDWGRACMLALLAVMAAIGLAELAALGTSGINIRKLNRQIEAVEARNAELRVMLERSSGDISVCTEAVKMNLVSSNGVRPILLTAPEGARMVLTETQSGQETDHLRASVTGTQGD